MTAARRGAQRLTRKERQQQTRTCLMRSAVRVFARRGMVHGSIDEVAAEAGYTKGAFYANFASKEELFLAMLDERFSERLSQLERLTATGADIEDQAREAGDDFSSYLAADVDWQRLFFEFVMHASRDEGFRAQLVSRNRTLRQGMAALFAKRIETLELPSPVPVEELAVMTFAMANGFALERLLEGDAASDDLYGRMLAIFFAGLRATAELQHEQAVQQDVGPSEADHPR